MWTLLLACAEPEARAAYETEDRGSDGTRDTGDGAEERDLTYTGPAYTFAGSASLTLTIDGEVVCDREATLTGSPYVGDCEGCTFAFDLDDEWVRHEGDGCELQRAWGPDYERLAFAPSYEVWVLDPCTGYDYDSGDCGLELRNRHDVLLGTTSDNPTWPWEAVAYDRGDARDSMSWDGTNLAWTIAYDEVTTDYLETGVLGICGGDHALGDPGAIVGESTQVEEDLPTTGGYDTWLVDLAAGETFAATLRSSAFVELTVTEPSGCGVYDLAPGDCASAYGDFDVPPTLCGSVGAAGTYTLVAWVPWDGFGGDYDLRVDGGTNLRLSTDDGLLYEDRLHSLRVTGSGIAMSL